MTSKVFLDTGYAVALAADTDYHYARAQLLADELKFHKSRLVTTQAILLEIGNALSKGRFRQAAVNTLTYLAIDPMIEVVPLTAELFSAGFRLFCERPDKEWGLVDCISFVVMQERGIIEALTADEHFEQAGFVALLRQG